jgi:tol-pal system-associated acyl-CoA thioesterase
MTAGGIFRWPVRVYYEDTDAGGVVYYANYLRFLERARTEWLASLGFTLTALQSDYRAVFVVHRLDIEYRKPARLYDALEVTLALATLGRSRFAVVQDVFRGDEQLVGARVALACLDPVSWRPTRIPAPVAVKIDLWKGL